MDLLSKLIEIYIVLLGIVFVVFHNKLGDMSTKFSEKVMQKKYSEDVWIFNRRGFVIVGLIFVTTGLLKILELI